MSGYKKEISTKQFYLNILFGSLISAAVTVAVLLIFAIVMLLFNVNSNLASPLASIALAVGSGVGGYTGAYKNKSKGILCGAVNAGIMYFVLSGVGLIICKDITLMSFIHLIVTLLASLIGGISGVNKADKIKII